MIRSLFAAVALMLVAVMATGAEARPRHHHARHHHHAHAPHGRPAACRGIPWCGCWLRLRYGITDRRLDRARAWANIGRRAPGPAIDVIAVWPHHVGVITGVLGNGMIRLLSGNDGNAVRDRVRSTRGIIAYRYIE